LPNAEGAEMTFSVSSAHYFNTSNYPDFKKLDFSFELYLEICSSPTDFASCARTSVEMKDATVPSYKQNFSTPKRKDGSYSVGYLWVFQP
jgi:hypothetical protein